MEINVYLDVVYFLFMLTILVGLWRIQNALRELIDISSQSAKTLGELSALIRARQSSSAPLPGSSGPN